MILVTLACVTVTTCSWFGSKKEKLFPVNLCLHANPKLHWYDGGPHTLYVRVFPLSTADAFQATEVADLIADPPPTVAGAAGAVQWRSLYPNTTVTLSFDAVPNQELAMIGVVAGYYKPEGRSKVVVNVTDLRGPGCYTVDFGPGGIEGGAPVAAPTAGEKKK